MIITDNAYRLFVKEDFIHYIKLFILLFYISFAISCSKGGSLDSPDKSGEIKMGSIYLTKIGKVGIDCKQMSEVIKERFNIEVSIIDTFSDVEFAYDKNRQQYFAPLILNRLEEFIPSGALRLIAIIDKDIYDRSLNFIFGEARSEICIVSINRFRPCAWREGDVEKELTTERAIKTAVHELGHTFGLRHCSNPKCVMYFSNWIHDTDNKSNNFCSKCIKSLKINTNK